MNKVDSHSFHWWRTAHIVIISLYFVGMVIGPVTKMRSHALMLLLILSLVLLLKNWRHQAWDKSVLLWAAVFSGTMLLSHVANGSSLSDIELFLLPLAFIPMVHVYRYADLDLFDWGMLILVAVTSSRNKAARQQDNKWRPAQAVTSTPATP